MPKLQLSLLTLAAIALTGCGEMPSGDASTYQAENHPDITRAPDLKSFTVDDGALRYSLHTEGAGKAQSIRLDVVDQRFGLPGEHAALRVLCASARFLKQDDWAIAPRFDGPESGLESCHEEAVLDGERSGISIHFYAVADVSSEKRKPRFDDYYSILLPAVEHGPAPPLVMTDANGNRVKVAPASPAKQLRVRFTRPGYDPGGYH
jgi:hypothetical protein